MVEVVDESEQVNALGGLRNECDSEHALVVRPTGLFLYLLIYTWLLQGLTTQFDDVCCCVPWMCHPTLHDESRQLSHRCE